MFQHPRLVKLLVALALTAGLAAESPAAAPSHATFAGGCFWCMVEPFERLSGVASVTSGYTGGTKVNPTYEEVSSGTTGHAESIDVVYDPSKITYEKLLDVYWHNVDPLHAGGQFCDHGRQYRTAIFFHDEAQRAAAEASKARVQAELHAKVVTEITKAGPFYRAEEYHQDFYKKNPARYHEYRQGCGRDARLRQLWGDKAGHGQEKP
jgi:peptide-methionine (S)-S-oxide reductase